jgi:RNA polymerase sigma factor (sigma-70 family)
VEPGSEEIILLPSVALDPVFAEAVDDAMSGEPAPTTPLDPNRVLGADPHDFAGLYIRHRSSFALHARRFLRDQRDIDEVVQEAFLRLFLALPELSTELQALAYCRRTITNLCIDRYRADQRRPRLVDLDSVSPDALLDDEPDDPVVQAEDAAIVREALALLSPLHRDALVKREIEEKSLPVVAAELGVPESSVKHLLHRARRALRRRLAETHLAPGVDLDGVSTLELLARSAAHGGGRLGVLAVLLIGLALGASSNVPVETLSGLWGAEEPADAGAAAGAARASAGGAPPSVPETGGRLPGVFGAERDHPGPVSLPPVPGGTGAGPLSPIGVPLVLPLPGTATLTVDTSPSASPRPSTGSSSPAATPTVAPSASPSTAPLVTSVVPTREPSPLPSASPTPAEPAGPSASPEPGTSPSVAASSTLPQRYGRSESSAAPAAQDR